MNAYVSVAQRVDPIRQSSQVDKYRAVVEKLNQSEPNDWPKFQEHVTKILQSAEFLRTEIKTNKGKSNEIIQTKTNTIHTARTQTAPLKKRKSPTKQNSHRSPIRPPKTVRLKKLVSPKAGTT